jgi:hypothetical protein
MTMQLNVVLVPVADARRIITERRAAKLLKDLTP